MYGVINNSDHILRLEELLKNFYSNPDIDIQSDINILVKAKDLDMIVREHRKLKDYYNLQHGLINRADHIIMVSGGTEDTRNALANLILMQIVLAGYIPIDYFNWADQESYLSIRNSDKDLQSDSSIEPS